MIVALVIDDITDIAPDCSSGVSAHAWRAAAGAVAITAPARPDRLLAGPLLPLRRRWRQRRRMAGSTLAGAVTSITIVYAVLVGRRRRLRGGSAARAV